MAFKGLHFLRRHRDHTPLYWLTYHLAIAPQPRRHDWQVIHDAGVRCVIDLRSQTQDDAQAITNLNMTFRHVPIVDGEALNLDSLVELTDWILDQQASQGPVLVHCREGRARSVMVGCSVLVRMGVRLPDAYRSVREVRGEDVVALSDAQVGALEELAGYCAVYPRWRHQRGA